MMVRRKRGSEDGRRKRGDLVSRYWGMYVGGGTRGNDISDDGRKDFLVIERKKTCFFSSVCVI